MTRRSTTPPISASRRPEPGDGTRNPARTRRNLLDAAYREFSARGFHATTVERICMRAGVSKQMLAHHFGSKQGAHLAVLEHAYAAARTPDLHLSDETIPPMEALRTFVGATFDYLALNRAFVSLQADENVNQGRHIRRSTVLPSLYDPLIRSLGRLLDRGVETGCFRAGVDPQQCYISISALCYFYVSNAFTLSAAFAMDLQSPDAIATRRAHVLDFVSNAVRA